MNLLESIVRNIMLSEANLADETYNRALKIDGAISRDEFDRLVKIDPTSQNGTPGRFTLWLVKHRTEIGKDNFEELSYALDTFNKKKASLKANGLSTNPDDYNVMSMIDKMKKGLAKKSALELNSMFKEYEGQFKIMMDGKRYLIVHCYTWEAEKFFGQGSGWCTVGSPSYFREYNAKDDLYINIPKEGGVPNLKSHDKFQCDHSGCRAPQGKINVADYGDKVWNSFAEFFLVYPQYRDEELINFYMEQGFIDPNEVAGKGTVKYLIDYKVVDGISDGVDIFGKKVNNQEQFAGYPSYHTIQTYDAYGQTVFIGFTGGQDAGSVLLNPKNGVPLSKRLLSIIARRFNGQTVLIGQGQRGKSILGPNGRWLSGIYYDIENIGSAIVGFLPGETRRRDCVFLDPKTFKPISEEMKGVSLLGERVLKIDLEDGAFRILDSRMQPIPNLSDKIFVEYKMIGGWSSNIYFLKMKDSDSRGYFLDANNKSIIGDDAFEVVDIFDINYANGNDSGIEALVTMYNDITKDMNLYSFSKEDGNFRFITDDIVHIGPLQTNNRHISSFIWASDANNKFYSVVLQPNKKAIVQKDYPFDGFSDNPYTSEILGFFNDGTCYLINPENGLPYAEAGQTNPEKLYYQIRQYGCCFYVSSIEEGKVLYAIADIHGRAVSDFIYSTPLWSSSVAFAFQNDKTGKVDIMRYKQDGKPVVGNYVDSFVEDCTSSTDFQYSRGMIGMRDGKFVYIKPNGNTGCESSMRIVDRFANLIVVKDEERGVFGLMQVQACDGVPSDNNMSWFEDRTLSSNGYPDNKMSFDKGFKFYKITSNNSTLVIGENESRACRYSLSY